MEYRLLDEVQGIEWCNHIDGGQTLIVGAFDGNVLVAYAVFVSGQTTNVKYMILEYIYVVEVYRERYYASQLLEYMEIQFRQKNISYIRARICSNEESAKATKNLLLGQEYILLDEKSTIFVYSPKEMLTAHRFLEIKNKRTIPCSLWHTYQKKEKCYGEFLTSMKRRKINLSELEYDHTNSIFYKDTAGNIVGCFLMSFQEENIYIKYVFLDQKVKDKQVMLDMLCSGLEKIRNYEKAKKVFVYLSKQKYVDLFEYLFPFYEQRVYVWDYEKQL